MSSEESCTGAVYQKEKCIKIHLPYYMTPAASPSASAEDERLGGGLIYGQWQRTRIGELPHLNYCACCLVSGGDCSPASLFHRVGSVVHCLMTLWYILLKGVRGRT